MHVNVPLCSDDVTCWYIMCSHLFLSFWDTHNRSCIDWRLIKMFSSCSCLWLISNAENPFKWSTMIFVWTSMLSFTIVKSFLYGHSTSHSQENVIARVVRFHFIKVLINMLVTKLRYDCKTRDTYLKKLKQDTYCNLIEWSLVFSQYKRITRLLSRHLIRATCAPLAKRHRITCNVFVQDKVCE